MSEAAESFRAALHHINSDVKDARNEVETLHVKVNAIVERLAEIRKQIESIEKNVAYMKVVFFSALFTVPVIGSICTVLLTALWARQGVKF